MFADLEAYKMEVAIWTGNEDMNAKSNTAPNEARVLLTTQQKLEAAFKHHTRFSDATGLRYLDRPRDVRIWDESLLPGSEVLLSADDLSGLWGHFRRSVSSVNTYPVAESNRSTETRCRRPHRRPSGAY